MQRDRRRPCRNREDPRLVNLDSGTANAVSFTSIPPPRPSIPSGRLPGHGSLTAGRPCWHSDRIFLLVHTPPCSFQSLYSCRYPWANTAGAPRVCSPLRRAEITKPESQTILRAPYERTCACEELVVAGDDRDVGVGAVGQKCFEGRKICWRFCVRNPSENHTQIVTVNPSSKPSLQTSSRPRAKYLSYSRRWPYEFSVSVQHPKKKKRSSMINGVDFYEEKVDIYNP